MMANEKRLIAENDVYALFGRTGKAELHVADIDLLPRVDAVEVVRCKDCGWARPQDHREPTDTPEQMIICQCFKNHHIPAPWHARLAVNPEHFCSYGERKDNEADI